MNSAFNQAYDAYVVHKQVARQLQWLQLRHRWLAPRPLPAVPAFVAASTAPLNVPKPRRTTP